MSKVEVLCPNGHRVTISVSQTTKIIEVLEEACLRKGFLPICDYELRHGGKTLECSASIQEAALINLAKLELVKRTKPWVESKVLVQVQTSTGARMQREFIPHDSLFEILERFEQDDGRSEHPKLLFHPDKAMQPVLNYVKEEDDRKHQLQTAFVNKLQQHQPQHSTTSSSHTLQIQLTAHASSRPNNSRTQHLGTFC